MARIAYSLVAPGGDVIPLATSAAKAGDFGLLTGSKGLGLAERALKIVSAPVGGRLRSARVAPRVGTLRVLAHGATRDALESNVRRLAAAVRITEGLPLPRLVATYETGEVYELPFAYESGAEDLEPPTRGGALEVPLNVTFPDPFWTARDAESVSVTGAQEVTGLLPDLAALHVMASTASGTLEVTNPGEVAAFPTWRIVGPSSSVSASSGGKGWTLAPVDAGEVILIDTLTNRVTLEATGENAYNRMGTAPKLFPLAPGRSSVAVTIADATEASSVTCFYRPRMEVVL